ncbi:MAG: hypothetical protein M3N33_01545 [Actinomycetota bacterium]|nr:hypothetical protein [Actinomycetota bacterium]
MPQGPPAATPDATGFRAFAADSDWNTPATGAAVNPDSEAIIDFLRSDSTADGCALLSGMGSNEWGMPVDHQGRQHPYLDSNGLDGSLPESDDPRNRGTFRGYNGAVAAIRLDEVQKGSVEHAVKVGVNTAHVDHVFPMTGSDGDLEKRRAPKQGMRLRIRSNVEPARYDLHAQALVIARALQTYGMMVVDSTGGPVELKLEDAANGMEAAWQIRGDALCAIPIDSYEVVDPSYFQGGGT